MANDAYLARKRKSRAKYCKTPKGKYNLYKKGADKREIPFTLTFDQFLSFWQNPCFYCGSTIATIGLDRLDNSNGYLVGNVVPCCFWCNRMKNKDSAPDFISRCFKVVGFVNRAGRLED